MSEVEQASPARRPKKWLWFAIPLVVLSLGAGYAFLNRGDISAVEFFNPAYWVRRSRGEDVYDAKNAILFHGNHRLKEVALTIDDGPHKPTGDQLLDILKQEGITATFFVVGSRMKENPDLVKRIVAEGHEIANHTQNHYRLPTLKPEQIRREINDADINLFRITGTHFNNLMRPPGVQYNDKVLAVTKDLGYQVITWTCAARDFEDVTPDYIVNRILSRAENGSIILLHDDRPGTVTALPRIIAALKQDGYKFVKVSEMLAHLPRPVDVNVDAK
ncbi:MAG: polysaccharide deacetylase family protein [Chthonomonadales bacterium]